MSVNPSGTLTAGAQTSMCIVDIYFKEYALDEQNRSILFYIFGGILGIMTIGILILTILLIVLLCLKKKGTIKDY